MSSSLTGLQLRWREFSASVVAAHLLQSLAQPFRKPKSLWEGVPISDVGHSLCGKKIYFQKLFSSIWGVAVVN